MMKKKTLNKKTILKHNERIKKTEWRMFRVDDYNEKQNFLIKMTDQKLKKF